MFKRLGFWPILCSPQWSPFSSLLFSLRKYQLYCAVGGVSIHLPASRLNSPGCSLAGSLSVDLWSSVLEAHSSVVWQPMGHWAALLGSPVLGCLSFLSDLQVLGGPHSSPGISAAWDIPGWSLLSLCGLLILSSLLNQKFLRRWRPVVFSFHTCTRIWDKLSQPAHFLISSLDNNSITQINN